MNNYYFCNTYKFDKLTFLTTTFSLIWLDFGLLTGSVFLIDGFLATALETS